MAKDPYQYFRVEARELLDGLTEGILQLEKGDFAPASEGVVRLLRLAHTLKGLAGNIGAEALQSRAAAVEAASRDHGNAQEIDVLLGALNDALQGLLKAIRSAIPAFPSTKAATDPASIQASLQQLRQLLEEEHADALSLLRAQRETFRAALGEDYATLAAAVEQFDFESALNTLNRQAQAPGE